MKIFTEIPLQVTIAVDLPLTIQPALQQIQRNSCLENTHYYRSHFVHAK